MATPHNHILIAGAGIGGLALAIMLEQAKIDYVIFEKAEYFKPLGSTILLSPQVLRVFEQLGIYKELLDTGIPIVDTRYYKQSRKQFGRIDQSVYETRYGYNCIAIGRPDLMDLLVRKIPQGKLWFNKGIVSVQQDEDNVTIKCSDGTTYRGDILIGADGAYSAVRQALYKTMAAKKTLVPASDTDPLRLESFCLVGLTRDIGHMFPKLNNTSATVYTIVASKTKAYNVNLVPLGRGRVGWNIVGKYLSPQEHDQKGFRYCDWDSEATEYLRKDVEGIALPIGGTLGDLIENTTEVSFVMLEDKFFQTWYDGRTVLLGDACHKLLPASGQGGNQAILDAVTLANLIQELPSPASPQDITKAFEKYYDIRAAHCKKMLVASRQLNDIMYTEKE
ncbi:hypothetical protein BGW42_000380 [Actinomortierella wolfii]|nr:hypothetical protein BGW42_000380 [Actinomortierella wolfii]